MLDVFPAGDGGPRQPKPSGEGSHAYDLQPHPPAPGGLAPRNVDLASALEAVVRRWYVIAIALLISGAVAVAIGKHTRQYVAHSAVILTSQGDVNSTSTAGAAGGSVPAGLSMQPSDLPILIQSESLLSRVAQDIGYGLPAGDLRRHIRAHVGLQNDIMSIDFADPSPQQAILGANAVADELTVYYRTIATARFSKLIVDLQKQITAKQANLARLDADLERTIAKDPDVAAKEPAVMSAQFASLQSQRDQLAAAARGDSEIAAYDTRLTAATVPLARRQISDDDPAYVALRSQYAKDAAELNRIRSAYSSSYPGLPELQDEVAKEARQVAASDGRFKAGTPLASQSYNDALKQQLQAAGQELADKERMAQIDAQIASLKATVTARMGSSVKAASLRRERDSADAALSTLQARLAGAEADRAVAGSLGSIAVISRAESADRTTWSKPKVVIIGMLAAGFWLALAIIAALQHFDRRLFSRRQIEGMYGLPVITTVGASLRG